MWLAVVVLTVTKLNVSPSVDCGFRRRDTIVVLRIILIFLVGCGRPRGPKGRDRGVARVASKCCISARADSHVCIVRFLCGASVCRALGSSGRSEVPWPNT